MARELKFRAWHKAQRKMFRPMTLEQALTTTPVTFKYEDVEVMQFTGFPDKNSNAIYDGDIVKSSDWSTIAKIEFLPTGKWGIVWQNGNIGNLYDFIEHIEVIGDIYRNPELISNQTS